MAYKGKRIGTLETDIERSREEGNWKRVIELASQLKERGEREKQNEALALGWFLVGEGKLEEHLEEFPPNLEANTTSESVREARIKLKEAKACLERTVGEDAVKIGVHLDSWILLAKLHFAMGNYSEALRFYEKAKLETLEEKYLPPRSLKIMAEAFAIKGLCYEKLPLTTTSKQKQAERENRIIRCFELSGDLTLLYLQEIDRSSPRGYHAQSTLSMQSVGTTTGGGGGVGGVVSGGGGGGGTSSSPVPPQHLGNTEHKLGQILETALIRAPQLYLRTGKVEKAIRRFRTMLAAEETRSTTTVRLSLARQLAETLMHTISEVQYKSPDSDSPKRASSRGALVGGGGSMSAPPPSSSSISSAPLDSPWKPRKYASSNQFQPSNKQEEVILLLLLCEVMASKHVPLNQTPEYDTHRTNTMAGAVAVFNLLSLALARHSHYTTLCDMFERSLRFAPKEGHIWSQFALSLACEGRTLRSVVVLSEVAEMKPDDASPCLLAARLCYERLGLLGQGIEWAERALRREEETPQDLRSRCHLYIGLGHYLMVHDVETKESLHRYSVSALRHLQLSVELDPGDHLAHFYLGLHLASLRKLNEAHSHANRALQLMPYHPPSLHLASLIFSARGEHEEALRLCEHALCEHPDNLPLMALKARLEEKVYGGEVALETTRRMFNLLRDLGEFQSISTDSGIGGDACDTRSVMAASYSHWDTLSDKDSVSLQAQSVAASQVERTMSEVASSLSNGIPKFSNHETAYNQIRTWLLTGELYLKLGQVESAEQCCNEARQIYPLSYHILYLKGEIHQFREEWEAAKICYQDSLSINPHHLPSLQSLGLTHLHLGSPRLAELALRSAIRLQPQDPVSWTYLGMVMESIEEESETAANCFAAAQDNKATAPILPFNTIHLAFE